VEDVINVSIHLFDSEDPLLAHLRDSFLTDVLMHHGRIPPKSNNYHSSSISFHQQKNANENKAK
jgi:hypothetical protein